MKKTSKTDTRSSFSVSTAKSGHDTMIGLPKSITPINLVLIAGKPTMIPLQSSHGEHTTQTQTINDDQKLKSEKS